MFIAYLGIGSNIGNRTQNCIDALEQVSSFTNIEAVSSFYETEPVGPEDQPKFINLVVKISTLLSPLNLLKSLKVVEKQLGRVKTEKWGPRVIDLDILFYEDFIIESQELTVPHPEAHKRKFVLEPLSEIEPSLYHPKIKSTVKKILRALSNDQKIIKIGKLY